VFTHLISFVSFAVVPSKFKKLQYWIITFENFARMSMIRDMGENTIRISDYNLKS
jgi:hypothetical protein